MLDLITVSTLNKMWIVDVDGTIVKHNGYKIDGEATLIEGVEKFFSEISKDDKVILVTARPWNYKEKLEDFLREKGIKFEFIIYDMPVGERILINDKKPSGLLTAIAINVERDKEWKICFQQDSNL